MKYNTEIKQFINNILVEGQVIEAKMNFYKQSSNFTEVLETLSFVYKKLELLNRQFPPLPLKLKQINIDDAYLETFHIAILFEL